MDGRRKTQLTDKQVHILKLVAQGFTYAEIADELGINERTVQDHTSRTYAFLGARNAAHAVYIAIGEGYLL